MLRRIALWRLELGAGAAAAVIGLLTLPMALLAPLYPVCVATSPVAGACPSSAARYVSLLAARPGAAVWALLVGLLALTLVGAAGAVVDARTTPAPNAPLIAGIGANVRASLGLAPLWGATLVVLAICALGSRGPLGLLYLPSTLALALAAYVALLRRLAARRSDTVAPPTPLPRGEGR
jgi:hypothetical protein